MNLRILTYSIIFILITSSFHPLHEIKISTSDIELKNNIIQIRIKLFADDLASALSQQTKKNVPFEGTSVDANTLIFLNQYIQSNVAITINNSPVTYHYKSSVIEENLAAEIKTVYLVYESIYSNKAPIKSFQLKNTLLFDAIPEQKNISKIRLLQNDETKILTFENQNGDTQKQLLF
jgi:hypothetical protein